MMEKYSPDCKKVSIITATYNVVSKNRKCYFYEMFRSVHEQDYPNIEHIIIDGGSKDGSVEFIQNMIDKYGKKECVFISEKDKGINDATNKGFEKSTGEYFILMCDDDYYTVRNAISMLVKKLEDTNSDYVSANCWWHDTMVWKTEQKKFAWRHPFVINTLLQKRENIQKIGGYFDLDFPMVGDFDVMYRLLKDENLKGTELNKVITVLRPTGISMKNNKKHCLDTFKIYNKYFNKKFKLFSDVEIIKLHYRNKPKVITVLKVLLFCKNKKVKSSIFESFNVKYYYKKFVPKLENVLFLKFLVKDSRSLKHMFDDEQKLDGDYTQEKSREFIDALYEF